METRLVTLCLRLVHLQHREHRNTDQGKCRRRTSQHCAAITQEKLAEPVGEGTITRANRLVVEKPSQVARECLSGVIALIRLAAQGFAHDGVDIATQVASQ